MSNSKPEFHLQRVNVDGTAEEPEIYSLQNLPDVFHASRRGFLGAGVSAASLLSLLGGCKPGRRSTATEHSQPARLQANQSFDIATVGYDDTTPDPETAASEEAVETTFATVAPPLDVQSSPVYAHSQAVRTLCFSTDGGLLISGGNDQLVKVWSIPDGTLRHTLDEHTQFVVSAAFANSGQALYTGAHDRSVNVWRVPEFTLRATLNASGSVHRITVSPNDRILAVAEDRGKITLWSTDALKEVGSIVTGESGVQSLGFAEHGILVTADSAGAVRLWSRDSKRHFGSELTPTGGSSAAVNHRGTYIATSSIEGDRIRLWSLSGTGFLSEPSGRLTRNLVGYANSFVEAIAFTPDDQTIVVAAGDKILCWSVLDGRHLRTMTGHARRISSLAVSPNGKLLASADWDGVIILWDATSGKLLSYLFDPEASKTDAFVYHVKDTFTGKTITYTLPCGSPIPPGATCICNCVPGTYKVAPAPSSGVGGTYCTCNKICICIPVCQALRLQHPEPIVRQMAEQLLLYMGRRELAYMRWAASRAAPVLRSRIQEVIRAVVAGHGSSPTAWPTIANCYSYLEHSDEIIAIMAAQFLKLHVIHSDHTPSSCCQSKIDELVVRAVKRPWYDRYL